MKKLIPVSGKFSYAKYLKYMDDHFFGTHKSTTIEAEMDICYDENHTVIAFYDSVNKELWAIS